MSCEVEGIWSEGESLIHDQVRDKNAIGSSYFFAVLN